MEKACEMAFMFRDPFDKHLTRDEQADMCEVLIRNPKSVPDPWRKLLAMWAV